MPGIDLCVARRQTQRLDRPGQYRFWEVLARWDQAESIARFKQSCNQAGIANSIGDAGAVRCMLSSLGIEGSKDVLSKDLLYWLILLHSVLANTEHWV